jgi:membrane protein
VFGIIKKAFGNFSDDECGVRAAALAYYTVFALPPLLILLVLIAGKIWGPNQVQRALESQFSGMIGKNGAQQVHEMIAHGQQSKGGGALASIASVVGLILGATGFFLSLQNALNRVWRVKPDPKQGGMRVFITKRLLSLGMVLGLGLLLAVSLALTAAVSALGGAVGGGLPEGLMKVVDLAVSVAVLTLLFAAVFRVLPDADIAWRDVWVGGAATSVFFVIGKFLIGLYLGRSSVASGYGAAGSVIIILLWIYYSSQILFLGAEFTQVYASHRGSRIEPDEHAVPVVEEKREVKEAGEWPPANRQKQKGAPERPQDDRKRTGS